MSFPGRLTTASKRGLGRLAA